ncbi:MAG TPA: sugar transferase [Bryobacteraceae bacterium]|nr:sugar transferase [Bryobacteraceae bacterium]
MIRLFNVSIPPPTFILLLSESVLLTGSFLLATLLLCELDPMDYLLHDYGIAALALVVVSFLLGLHFQDLYTQIRVKSRVLLLQQLCMVTGIAFVAQGLISYIDADLRVSVRVMLAGSVMAMPGIFLWRMWFGNVASQMIGQTRLLLVGNGPTVAQLRNFIQRHPEAGLGVEALVETAEELEALDEVLRTQQPPKIIFSGWGRPHAKLMDELMGLQLSGYEVQSAAITYEQACSRVSLYSLRPEHLIYSSTFAVPPQRFFYQVVLNGAVAGMCLLGITPILAITALALRLFQRGPVLRGETVTGLNGRLFRLHKFNVAGNSLVARAVRKLQLDGLPQFLSVVKGDLAIVGPRAIRPEYLEAIEQYIPFYRERCAVRPGITGWAQIQATRRQKIPDTMDALEYDLYYIKNRSFGLDTLILLHAIKSMMLAAEEPEEAWAEEEMSASTR